MIPFGNNTVTVIERLETTGTSGKTAVSYSINNLYGCSWSGSNGLKTGSTEHDKTVSYICRIPATDQRCPCVGDLVILGSAKGSYGTPREVEALYEKYRASGAFYVTKVKDNARAGFPLAHYVVEGS